MMAPIAAAEPRIQQITLRVWKLRRDLDELSEHLGRLAEAAQQRQRRPQIVQGFGELRIDANGLAKTLHGRGGAAGIEQNEALIVQRERVGRLLRQGALDALQCPRAAPQPAQRGGEIVPALRKDRLQSQRADS